MALFLDRPADARGYRSSGWCLDIVVGTTVVQTLDFCDRDAVLEEIERLRSRPRGQSKQSLAKTRDQG
jgi:hypothetical protein